ncbi:hypothetical protein BH10PSE10_BH10PSE10_03540 [soil metagenome]
MVERMKEDAPVSSFSEAAANIPSALRLPGSIPQTPFPVIVLAPKHSLTRIHLNGDFKAVF